MCTDEDCWSLELSFDFAGTSEVGVFVDDVGVGFHIIILINDIMMMKVMEIGPIQSTENRWRQLPNFGHL